MSTEVTESEPVAADAAVDMAQPPAPPAPPTPKPQPKRTATKTPPAAQEPRMSDEPNVTNNAAPTIPAELLKELAEAKAAKAELAKLQAERESLLKEHETVKADVKSLAEKYQQTEAAKLKADEDNRRLRINTAVERAASAYGAVKSEQIVRLLDGVFGLDEKGNVIASDDTKKPVDEYVKKYLEDNAHLAGRKVAAGSGASPFPAQSAPSSGKPIDLSTNEGLTAFTRGLGARR